MMRIDDVLAALGEMETGDPVREHWEESMAAFPRKPPSFLDPGEIRGGREWAGLEPEVDAALAEAARRIRDNPALLRLAWHCYWCLFEGTDTERITGWPSLERALDESSGAFYLLVVMGMIPKVRALHQSMGVPAQVTRDTCAQIRCVVDRHQYATGGQLGTGTRTLYWFRHYVNGDLFRVGRFEYMIRPFRGTIVAYRNRETDEVFALAEDGLRFDEHGIALRPEDETEGAWMATLVADGDSVTGYPISPHGMAVRRKVALPLKVWRKVLHREHNVLQMHIPGGGGMTPERCAASMQGAVEFFRRTFPDKPFAGIASRSWIFNTQLHEILPPTANLVTYQDELYLFPIPSGPTTGLYFIFLQDDPDWATAPRDTSLQRAVADFISAGNTWRAGAMFMLNEDVARYGAQCYQSRWPPAVLR